MEKDHKLSNVLEATAIHFDQATGRIVRIKTTLPGFGFAPSDEDLISHYLKPKIEGKQVPASPPNVIGLANDVNFYEKKPKDWTSEKYLPILNKATDTEEWYFFTSQAHRCKNGVSQVRRSTNNGYWKAGNDKMIKDSTGDLIGMRKTLTFYEGKYPNDIVTGWCAYEYRILCCTEWVLYRLYYKESKKVTIPDVDKEGKKKKARIQS